MYGTTRWKSVVYKIGIMIMESLFIIFSEYRLYVALLL